MIFFHLFTNKFFLHYHETINQKTTSPTLTFFLKKSSHTENRYTKFTLHRDFYHEDPKFESVSPFLILPPMSNFCQLCKLRSLKSNILPSEHGMAMSYLTVDIFEKEDVKSGYCFCLVFHVQNKKSSPKHIYFYHGGEFFSFS